MSTSLDFPFFLSHNKKERRKKRERKAQTMLEFENQNIEFKQEYVPDILKEIGFENAESGIVYVGVRKDGAVLVIGNRWCSNHGRCCIPRYLLCILPELVKQ